MEYKEIMTSEDLRIIRDILNELQDIRNELQILTEHIKGPDIEPDDHRTSAEIFKDIMTKWGPKK